MKNIVITGATSFIGIHLIKLLQNKNVSLHLILRKNSKNKYLVKKFKFIKIYEISMDDYNNIDKYIDFTPDCLVHCAWNGTRKPERDNEDIQKENYYNSLNLFKKFRELGCKKIINLGSQAEYGKIENLTSEDSIANPITYYGKYKLKICKEAESLFKNTNTKFYHLRIFSLYGIGDFKNSLIMSSISKMIQNKDVDLTESTQKWNFLNIEDAVRAIELFIFKDYEEGRYNLASADTRFLKEYIYDIKEEINSNSRLIFGKIPYSKEGKNSINPDITKLLNTTMWRETISFKSGIKKIIEYESK